MSFLGRDGFIWWVGVVEDRFDPKFLGRCKVRILGWHTEDKAILPTDGLPWCMPIQPITSAAQTGVGHSPTGPVEGTWVFGFYRDGEEAQEPMMLGTMGGIPQEVANSDVGFFDPRAETEYIPFDIVPGGRVVERKKQLSNVPRDPDYVNSVYKPGQKVLLENRGVGATEISTYPDARYVTNLEPTTPRLARGVSETTAHNKIDKNGQYRPIDGPLYAKERTHYNGVPRAKGGALANLPTFDEPSLKFNAQYPYNHVHQSESGHVIEVDDTPKHERLHWFHRSGSFQEMKADGDVITKSVGDLFQSSSHNSFETVKNEKVSTISAGYETFVNEAGSPNNDYFLKVGIGGNIIMRTEKGNIDIDAGRGKLTLRGGEIDTNYTQNVATTTSETYSITAGNISTFTEGNTDVVSSAQTSVIGTPLILASSGATSVISQSVTQSIAETSVENLQSILSVKDPYAKEINAVFGKIKLESVDAAASGGIELNTGLAGAASQLKLDTQGDIKLTSLLGGFETSVAIGDIETTALKGDIKVTAAKGKIETTAALGDIETIASVGSIKQTATKNIDIEAKGNLTAKATTISKVMGQAVQLNTDATEQPVILGQKFMEEFTKHQHATGTGPSGPVLNAAPYVSTLSKKVFSG